MTEIVRVPIKTDEKGLLGRECPSGKCGQYFKLKPGTGLPIDECSCPYCGTKGDSSDFLTEDQLRYAQTYGAKKILDPILSKFAQDIEQMNRGQRGGLFSLEFSVRRQGIRVHSYIEKQLETEVTCDWCGLEFAVYGVFASCPDCGQLNALKVCLASLETAKKKLTLSKDQRLDADLRRDILRDALAGAIGAFDAYGKALRARRTSFASKAKSNLFQDIEALDGELKAGGMPGIEQSIGTPNWEQMKWFFQARHIYTHNAGVVDARFVAKQPSYGHMLGRILPLEADQIRKSIDCLGILARKLDTRIR